MRRTILPLILISAFAWSTAAQEGSPEPEEPFSDEPVLDLAFEGMVEVSEVLLDVLATDEDGTVVEGLGPEDFIVEENGETVALTSVDYYTTRYGEETQAAEEAPSSRYFIFFFHNQWQQGRYGNDLMRQQMRAGLESRRWLEEEMLPSDWVAVVSYGRGLRMYQDFTQDREALTQAFRAAAAGKKPASDVPLRRRSPGAFELGIMQRLPKGHDLKERTKNVYQALGVVAETCGYLVGRKNLLLFTIGFGNEVRFGEAEADPRYYPQLETRLNDHNVAVYPIDLSPAGRGTRQTDFLTQLAEDTGGVYHEDFYGFINPLRDIGGDNYAYYVLSYQSEHPAGEIGYQRIEVKTRDESIQVRTRKGYRYGL
ncbi:MAG: VWA domain-containing protein [Acidobacteriota bacterium]